MDNLERKAAMESVVKRTDRLTPFFDSEGYAEWAAILAKKVDTYRALLNRVPRVGEEKTMTQISTVGDRREITEVKYRVTAEERTFAIEDLNSKIQELTDVLAIPALMKADAERMKAVIAKIGDKQ